MPGTSVKNPELVKEVLEFLSSTSTDWAEPEDELRETASEAAARTELQIMIARKRRNDAMRMAELNLLRRIRQAGLTGDQIRAFERAQAAAAPKAPANRGAAEAAGAAGVSSSGVRQKEQHDEAVTQLLPARGRRKIEEPAPAGPPASKAKGRGAGPTHGAERAGAAQEDKGELDEVHRDDELDQAALAFANADFSGCEAILRELVGPGGRRQQHVPTWRTLLDLYRATGQQRSFERLAVAYTRDLGQASPQWESIPRMAMNVGDRPSQPAPAPTGLSQAGGLEVPAWQCPTLLDASAVHSMLAFQQGEPAVRVVDWTTVKVLTHEGAQSLLEALQAGADKPGRLVWKGTASLLDLLRDTPRAEGRPEDEVLWQLSLTVLRLMGVQGPYDLKAQDFEAAYGKPAPAWSPAAAKIMAGEHWRPPSLASTAGFSVSALGERQRGPAEVTVELVGQLTGDINDTLARTLSTLQGSRSVIVSCTRLIRVDLMAAGELLTWVGARRTEGRTLKFVQVHRLLAQFLCAMGLNDQATIELRSL